MVGPDSANVRSRHYRDKHQCPLYPSKRTLIYTTLISAYPQKRAKRIERSALCHNLCIELRRSSRQCGYEGWGKKMRNLPGLTAWIAGVILCLVSVHVPAQTIFQYPVTAKALTTATPTLVCRSNFRSRWCSIAHSILLAPSLSTPKGGTFI